MTDLTVATFIALRKAFFQDGPAPRAFQLRDKRNTQADPLDEHIQQVLSESLDQHTYCLKAPGPLITPDLVVLRPELCEQSTAAALRGDPTRIVAIEVKKLERQKGGTVARASGMDYNTTPPCGTVRVYDRFKRELHIKGFYLFVCQEAAEQPGAYQFSAMALCDGDLLNADFDLYQRIVGSRKKQTELGSYRDGADRNRPMLIFVNPLGASVLDHQATLVHSRGDLADEAPELQHVGVIKRSIPGSAAARFHCYRMRGDIQPGQVAFDETDPFPVPKRTEKTQGRGRFVVEIAPAG